MKVFLHWCAPGLMTASFLFASMLVLASIRTINLAPPAESAVSSALLSVAADGAAVALWAWLYRKQTVVALRPERFSIAGIALCLLVGLSLQLPIGYAIDSAFHFAESWAPQLDCPAIHLTGTPAMSGAAVFAVALCALFASPVLEELAFRQIAYARMRGSAGSAATIVTCAVAFAFIHPGLAAGIQSFAAGLVLGYLRERTQTVLAPIAAHAGFNLGVLLFQQLGSQVSIGFPQRAFEVPPWWVLANLSATVMLLLLIRACVRPRVQTRMVSHA